MIAEQLGIAYYDKELPGCAAFLRAAVEAHIR